MSNMQRFDSAVHRGKKRNPRRRGRLCFETLEGRRMLATFVVENNLDGRLGSLFEDGELSLREAIDVANLTPGADTITFDPAAFAGGEASLIRLTAGELIINDTLTIDGSTGVGVTITADALGNDVLQIGTFVTDVDASLAADEASLDDNTRVLRFQGASHDLTLESITVTGGNANGGGLSFERGGRLAINRSSISGNRSEFSAGGVYSRGAALEIVASTISGNRSESNGGGVYTRAGVLTLADSVVTDNSAATGGGIYVPDRYGSVTESVILSNTIIAENVAQSELSAPDLRLRERATLDARFSLIGDNTGTTLVAPPAGSADAAGNLIGTASRPIDPRFGLLADNGGPTPTHALLPGSPAIDAGRSEEPADQRGLPRSVDITSVPNGTGDSSDIGAFELQSASAMSVPSGVTLRFEPLSKLDLSALTVIDESGVPVTVTLVANGGEFASPAFGAGVTAELTSPRSVSVVGKAEDLNRYFDNPSNIKLTPAEGVVGEDAAEILVVADGLLEGIVSVTVVEAPSLIVNTQLASDQFDLKTSLWEAIELANQTPGADTITFDPEVFSGGSSSVIRLTEGELVVTDTLTIDGSTGTDIVITADAMANDQLVPGTFITDIDASLAADEMLLDDNSRVLSFQNSTGDLTLQGITLTGGNVAGDGAGIRFDSVGQLNLHRSEVSGNATRERSFGIFGSKYSSGGGIFTNNGAVALTESTVSGNASGEYGGGIYTETGAVTLIRSTVSENYSKDHGGGIYTEAGDVTLTASTISGNDAGGDGGGVFTYDGAITLNASTVSGNRSDGRGGGIYTEWEGALTLTDSTITENHSESDGGGVFVEGNAAPFSAEVVIRNTILAGNSVGSTGIGPNLRIVDRARLDVFSSLIGNNAGTTLASAPVGSPDANGNLVGTPSQRIDPMLAPLADNGGPTPTHALTLGSPAVDAGSSVSAFDQRGLPRSVDITSLPNGMGDGPDMGAVELQSASAISVPSGVTATFETLSELDLSALTVIEESGVPVTVTLVANDGEFASPAVSAGVAAELTSPRSVTVVGKAEDLNRYFDNSSNIRLTPALGAIGENVAAIDVNVEGIRRGTVNVTVVEAPSLIVNTQVASDQFDLKTSFLESLQLANETPGPDTISFDPSVFSGGASSVIRLTEGELVITDTLTIDGSTGTDIVITADAMGNDQLVADTFITDIDASLEADDNSLDDNSRVLWFQSTTGNLTLQGVTLTGGNVAGDGAGIRFDSGGQLNLHRSAVSGNRIGGGSTYSSGAGIYAREASVTLTDSAVSRNSASGNGGGIYVYSFTNDLTVVRSTIFDNRSEGGAGGGIYSFAGDLMLVDSTVFGNSSEAGGGGIFKGNRGLSITRSTISGNTSAFAGGGVFNSFGTAILTDSTVTGNYSRTGGGGLHAGRESDSNPRATVDVRNSIIAGNTVGAGGTGPDLNILETATLDAVSSLIGDNTGTTLGSAPVVSPDADGNLIGTALSPIDPQLAPLADNGGPTPTHALLPGSPAVDAGTAPGPRGTARGGGARDQRGFPRPIDIASLSNVPGDGSDIGAFELQTPVSTFMPNEVFVTFESLSDLDLSAALVVNESRVPMTVTLTVSGGEFATPADGSDMGAGTSAELTNPRNVTLVGLAEDINRYLDDPANLQLTPAAGVVGEDAAAILVDVDGLLGGVVSLTVVEAPSLVVDTRLASNPFDLKTSLWEAIELANRTPGADTIKFDPLVFSGGASSVIRLTDGELVVTDTLTIDGSTATDVLITADAFGNDTHQPGTFATDVDASLAADETLLDDNSRVLRFASPTGDLTLRGLALTGGNETSGGGLRFESEGQLTLEQTTVTGNRTVGDGGGIYSQDGDIVLNESSVSGNVAADPPGGYTGPFPPKYDYTSGGGIYSSSGNVTLTGSVISANRSEGYGGGVQASEGTVTLSNSVVEGNVSDNNGGGIRASYGSLILTESTVAGNHSDRGGGGISTASAAVSLMDSSVTGNRGDFGGGVSTSRGAVTVTRSTISGNYSEGAGGGIFTSSGVISITSSTVSGNESGSIGGGITTYGSAISLTRSTITGNHGEDAGGGLSIGDNFVSDTLDSITINASIVAGNTTGPSGFGADLRTTAAVAFDVQYSLIGVNTGVLLPASPIDAEDPSGNFIGTASDPIDPLLGPLADNGGPTQTHALLQGSPAINAGDPNVNSPTEYDQRGADFTRVVGPAIDIGSYELQAEFPSLLVTTAADVVDDTDFVTSLREAISYANEKVGADTIAFDPAVLSGGEASVIRLTQGELEITDTLTIDGSIATDVVISGDALGNDQTQQGTFITNVEASLTADPALLDDNSRVLRFSTATGDLTVVGMTLTGGRTTGDNQYISDGVEGAGPKYEGTHSGGGIQFLSSGTLTIAGSRLSGNSTSGRGAGGGGIFAYDGSVTLVDSTISRNRVSGTTAPGGGISTYSGDVTLTSSTVSDNTVAGFKYGYGGGIASISGNVTLTGSEVSRNAVPGVTDSFVFGGGIYTSRGDIALTDSVANENSSENGGGGIFTFHGDTTLMRSAVSGNVSGVVEVSNRSTARSS